MTELRYVFGRRQKQDLVGYPSGPYSPFVFTVGVTKRPHSWHSAYALLGFYRDDFVKASRAACTSSALHVIEGRDVWIPTYYLEKPTIEFIGESGAEELLLDGERPNPWLSVAR